MSEHPDTGVPPTAPDHRIRVAVLAVDDAGLAATLAAVERQVYEIADVTIVDPDGAISDPGDMPLVGEFAEFVASLDQDTDLVWIVHGDARPRPDALGALVTELERNDASLVGSKIIDAFSENRLESVGSATDVFGEPYTGLDPDEVDLEQYDVVRDVAFVSAVSMLVRRDLLRGLRGIDPLLPPVAAGMDFSQRARVAGGRVMVAPSSEVLHERTCRDDVAGWREWAGRMRSMLKAYRLITLAWVVPIGTMLGFLDGIARLVLGTARPLGDFWRALAWNLIHLPGSLTARNSVRAVRQVGDEELFRYQVSGSVRLRSLVADVGERFGWVIDDEPGIVDEDEVEDEGTAAGPVVAVLGLVVVALATRSFWAGTLPQVGFTFRVSDVAVALDGFAGGWNPAGLGSSEPVHPSAAFFAAFEWVSGGWSAMFRVVVAGLLVSAFFGAGRLLKELGVPGPSRHLAGVVAVIGVGTGAFAADADLAGWLAIGPTLVTLALVAMPWPTTLWTRLGRAGLLALAAGSAALLAPGSVVVVVVVGVLLWLWVPDFRVGVAARALLAADIGLLVVAPYLAAVTAAELVRAGPIYDLRPGFLPAVGLAGAVVGTVAFGSARRRQLAAVSGLLLALGLWYPTVQVAQGDLGAAVALATVVGVVVGVGSAIGFERDASRVVTVGRAAATLAAAFVVAAGLVHVVNGRVGFPEDQWSERLAFTTSLASESDSARVLVVGDPSEIPGESRTAGGFHYRLVPLSGPGLESARLGEPRLGDDALAGLVEAIAGGELVRPGQALAEFGIGWVAVVDDPAFTAAMAAQVDMNEVAVSEELTVFANSVDAPRAVDSNGTVWLAEGNRLRGPSGPGTVRIADNASPRWQPDWEQDNWANRVSAETGLAVYEPNPLRRILGWISLAVMVLGIAASPLVRRRSS